MAETQWGDWRKTGEWADDDEVTWNSETGAPTKMHFANAIQVWSVLQSGEGWHTVAEAAAVFNVPPARVVEAVAEHPWMCIAGPQDDYSKMTIEHDGE